jgi:hypothetical protein
VLARPGDPRTRILAADRMTTALEKHKQQITWWSRIETRDAAIAKVRAVAHDSSVPADVRQAAVRVLASWGAFQDRNATP